ncbi:atpE [Symbiodinium natans]|uniref:AtpE protein n=1 Tax=Symbiodinium natans TaxID=878477 RepID=A0A812RQJ4_9DINO|nr:atpE [Symbiodinium natans]
MCMVLFLPLLTAADSYFSSTPAKIEAKVTLQINGFCFGQAGPEETKAAELKAHVDWQGGKDLGNTGPVMLVAFDASEHRWGAVKDSWGQLSCEEKLSAANMKRQLGETHNLDDFFFSISVYQKTAIRDWHFALLTCGETEQAPLSLSLEALSGALSMFNANTHFDSSSCPVVDVPWVAAAHDEVGFWLLLIATLALGCFGALGVVACRRYRNKVQLRQFEQTATAGGAEPVIGRPCSQVGEVKVVDGQVNSDQQLDQPTSPECSNVAPEQDSSV